MKKVLVFGTYDIFHPGHVFFLKEARKYGGILNVVVALDATVMKVKGKLPTNKESDRLARIKNLDYVDKAYLGKKGDKYAIIEELKPDVIVLGYDQNSFTGGLKEMLNKKKLDVEVVRIKKSYKADMYKSSILNSKLIK